MKIPFFVALAVALPFVTVPLLLAADSKQSRDEMVLEDRAELIGNDTWIYNDLEKAKAVAKAANKPLMIVFRCIP
ncbi:MAG: hypothetical protein P1U86_21705 [Verrucomicrobiales bacterium]|nr:hypothetical protein [Verrucomicrobiales bacterium]